MGCPSTRTAQNLGFHAVRVLGRPENAKNKSSEYSDDTRNKTFETMKKFLCALALILLPSLAPAQTVTGLFGYISYEKTLKAMPEYAAASDSLAALRAQYDAEMRRAEEEFNKKYVEFLEGQRDFAPSIYKKRQAELVDWLGRNVAFKKEAGRLLRQAERDAFAAARRKLAEAVRAVAAQRRLAFVLNTDGDAVPYINPELGEDITPFVLEALSRR